MVASPVAALGRLGLADSARAVIAQARDGYTGNDLMTDLYEANAWLQLGETDETLRLLGAYLEAKPDRKDYIREDWWWRPLHDDPRFKALVGDGE